MITATASMDVAGDAREEMGLSRRPVWYMPWYADMCIEIVTSAEYYIPDDFFHGTIHSNAHSDCYSYSDVDDPLAETDTDGFTVDPVFALSDARAVIGLDNDTDVVPPEYNPDIFT